MNAVSIIYVNSYLDSHRSTGKEQRSLTPNRGLIHRIGSAFRVLIGTDPVPVVPQLRNYPYGS